jgi:hypothetical protein
LAHRGCGGNRGAPDEAQAVNMKDAHDFRAKRIAAILTTNRRNLPAIRRNGVKQD